MTKKEIELADLWANGTISLATVARKLKGDNNKAYSFLARALRQKHYEHIH
jgi:DNA-binding CsgD family transcriptional regulator